MMENDNEKTLQETTEIMIQEDSLKNDNANEEVETFVIDNLEDKKKTNKFIPILGVLFVLIVLSLVGYRYLFLVNKKNIIRNDVTAFFNFLDKSVDSVKNNTFPINFNEESVGFNGKVTFSSNYKDSIYDLTDLDKYNFEYMGAVDLKNNKLSFDAKLNKDNDALLTLEAFIKEKLALIKSSELSYETYKYQLTKKIKELDLDSKFNVEDIDKLVLKTKDIVISNVDDNKIEKKTVKETIDSKEDSYILVSYTFDVKELITNIISSYKEDDEILDILGRITSQEKDEVKKDLDNIDYSKFEGFTLTVNNYSTKVLGKLKKIGLVLSKNDKSVNFDILNVSEGYAFEVYSSENEEKVTGKYDVAKKELTVKYNKDELSFDLSLVRDNNNYTLKVNIVSKNQKISVDFKTTSNISNDKKEDTMDINVVYNSGKGEDITFNVRSELTISKNAEVKEFDGLFAKDIKSISESDLYFIEYKLQNIYSTILNDFVKYNSTYNFSDYSYNSTLDLDDNYNL